MNIDKPFQRGKINWDKIKATTDEEINREAAYEDANLGLDRSRLRYSRVFNLAAPNVRVLRERLCLSQSAFATKFGISVRTVQQWEQHRSTPDQPAKVLLRIISFAPEFVSYAIEAAISDNEPTRPTRLTRNKLAADLFRSTLDQDRINKDDVFTRDPMVSAKSTVSTANPNSGAAYATR